MYCIWASETCALPSRDVACCAKMSRIRAVRSTTLTLTTSSRWISWPGLSSPSQTTVSAPDSLTISRSSSALPEPMYVAGSGLLRRWMTPSSTNAPAVSASAASSARELSASCAVPDVQTPTSTTRSRRSCRYSTSVTSSSSVESPATRRSAARAERSYWSPSPPPAPRRGGGARSGRRHAPRRSRDSRRRPLPSGRRPEGSRRGAAGPAEGKRSGSKESLRRGTSSLSTTHDGPVGFPTAPAATPTPRWSHAAAGPSLGFRGVARRRAVRGGGDRGLGSSRLRARLARLGTRLARLGTGPALIGIRLRTRLGVRLRGGPPLGVPGHLRRLLPVQPGAQEAVQVPARHLRGEPDEVGGRGHAVTVADHPLPLQPLEVRPADTLPQRVKDQGAAVVDDRAEEPDLLARFGGRSEERRVGEECRSR